MASSYGLCVHPGPLFCKVLEQMSMINFMNYFLITTAEGFVPSHAPFKNNKHLNIPFQLNQPRRGKDKSESQGLTPSSQVRACGTRRGSWGRASILSVMPNAAPDIRISTTYGWHISEEQLKHCRFQSGLMETRVCTDCLWQKLVERINNDSMVRKLRPRILLLCSQQILLLCS